MCWSPCIWPTTQGKSAELPYFMLHVDVKKSGVHGSNAQENFNKLTSCSSWFTWHSLAQWTLQVSAHGRCWRAGDNGGQVPGAAERVRAAVAGAHARGGPCAGRPAAGGGHEQSAPGPLHLWPPPPVCQLLRTAAHHGAAHAAAYPAGPASHRVLAGRLVLCSCFMVPRLHSLVLMYSLLVQKMRCIVCRFDVKQ